MRYSPTERARSLASTFGDEDKAGAIAREAIDLLQGANGPGGEPSQVQVAFLEGSVFVVRDGERIVVAVTGREPTVGLVFYDLKTCLRLAGEQPAREAGGGRRAGSQEEGREGRRAMAMRVGSRPLVAPASVAGAVALWRRSRGHRKERARSTSATGRW